MHRYIVMGPPGCGKGTQASALAAGLGVPHVSSGDLFRRAAAAGDGVGRRAGPLMTAGALVPDDLTIALVEARLAARDCRSGFVLDGFPRTHAQASFLLDRWRPDAVLLFDVPDEVVVARLMARRHCADCGRDHNLLLGRPAIQCRACGGRLTQRPDDTPEAVRRRLADYHRQTAPLLALFRQRGLLVAIDGARDPDAVGAAARAAIALRQVEERARDAGGRPVRSEEAPRGRASANGRADDRPEAVAPLTLAAGSLGRSRENPDAGARPAGQDGERHPLDTR